MYTSVETVALVPTISLQNVQNNKFASIQWNVINVVENLDGNSWKYPACNNVTIKLTSKNQEDETQFFRYNVNSKNGTIVQDALNHSCAFIKTSDNAIMQVLSACNNYKMENGKYNHIEGTQFKRSF